MRIEASIIISLIEKLKNGDECYATNQTSIAERARRNHTSA
jgi:hypothetical protein